MDLALTSAGKRRVQGTRDQSIGARMLGHIDASGRLSVEELASLMGIPTRRVRSIANKLHRKGLLQVDE